MVASDTRLSINRRPFNKYQGPGKPSPPAGETATGTKTNQNNTHTMKAHTRNTREALLIAAGTIFFPLLCVSCWWINLLAIVLLGGAALLNPEYIGG